MSMNPQGPMTAKVYDPCRLNTLGEKPVRSTKYSPRMKCGKTGPSPWKATVEVQYIWPSDVNRSRSNNCWKEGCTLSNPSLNTVNTMVYLQGQHLKDNGQNRKRRKPGWSWIRRSNNMDKMRIELRVPGFNLLTVYHTNKQQHAPHPFWIYVKEFARACKLKLRYAVQKMLIIMTMHHIIQSIHSNAGA